MSRLSPAERERRTYPIIRSSPASMSKLESVGWRLLWFVPGAFAGAAVVTFLR